MNQEHDPYEVVYRIKQLQIAEVNCAFKIFKASLNTYRNDMLSAEMYLWVGTDHSAQSPEFFDIKNHLRISFTARSIERSKNCNELWGDLKINGHNKRVTLIVDEVETITDHQGNERGGLYISGKLNRKDLGMVWNLPATGETIVSDEVMVSCFIESVKENVATKIENIKKFKNDSS